MNVGIFRARYSEDRAAKKGLNHVSEDTSRLQPQPLPELGEDHLLLP
jgi:hypothetical protein